MRLSADKTDEGYSRYRMACANGKTVRVFLNGIEQRNVITADDDIGFIERPVRDARGKLQADPLYPDRILTERVTGLVVIEFKPSTGVFCHA